MFGAEVSFDTPTLRLTTRPSHRGSCHEGASGQAKPSTAEISLHQPEDRTFAPYFRVRCASLAHGAYFNRSLPICSDFSSWILNLYPSKHYLWSRKGLDGPKWQRMDDRSPRGPGPRGCTVKISWRQIYFERSRPVASPRLQAMATSLAMCLKRSLGLLVHPSIVARLSRPL